MGCDIPHLLSQCPPFTRLLLLSGLLTTLLSQLTPAPMQLLPNSPAQTLHGQLWRILTAPFVYEGVLDYLLTALMLLLVVGREEARYSTVLLACDFVGQGVLLQAGFTVLAGGVGLAGVAVGVRSAGCFPMVMFYYTRRCMANPECPSQMLCCPSTRNKFIPPILGTLLSLLSMNPDVLLAVISAMLQSKFCNHSLVRLSGASLKAVEDSCLCAVGCAGRVPWAGQELGLGGNTSFLAGGDYIGFAQPAQSNRPRPQFQPFAGTSRTMMDQMV
jgi:membrane associated rhomboid family serine protease